MFNEHAVAVRRDKSVVGHLPHEISRFFVHKRHSKMTCEITGHRHDSRYLSQIKGQTVSRKGLARTFLKASRTTSRN